MGALSLAASGCGHAAGSSPPRSLATATREPAGQVRMIGGKAPAERRITSAARSTAVEKAARMLAAVIVPPGSRHAAHVAGSHLAGPAMEPGCSPLEDDTLIWVVPQPPGAVNAFLLAHVPATMTNNASGGSTTRGVATSYVDVDGPAGKSPSEDELVFTFASLGGGTELRADALAVPSGAQCVRHAAVSRRASGGGGR